MLILKLIITFLLSTKIISCKQKITNILSCNNCKWFIPNINNEEIKGKITQVSPVINVEFDKQESESKFDNKISNFEEQPFNNLMKNSNILNNNQIYFYLI
jgi:hypothetical protein